MPKTKAEKQAEKQKRKENRESILLVLTNLKGKDIKAMTAKEKEDLLIAVCNFLGISEKGIIK